MFRSAAAVDSHSADVMNRGRQPCKDSRFDAGAPLLHWEWGAALSDSACSRRSGAEHRVEVRSIVGQGPRLGASDFVLRARVADDAPTRRNIPVEPATSTNTYVGSASLILTNADRCVQRGTPVAGQEASFNAGSAGQRPSIALS